MPDSDAGTLREHYTEMSDGELMSLANQMASLEPVACRLLNAELHRRGLSECDVAAFREEVQAERRKAKRVYRKRLYRILVGAGGRWERAYSYWKWATLGAFGTGYMLRLFGCRNPLLIVGGAMVGFLITFAITMYAAQLLTAKHKRKRASEAGLPSR
jgi:hypothetical protein